MYCFWNWRDDLIGLYTLSKKEDEEKEEGEKIEGGGKREKEEGENRKKLWDISGLFSISDRSYPIIPGLQSLCGKYIISFLYLYLKSKLI
jgi:hypothetical protein